MEHKILVRIWVITVAILLAVVIYQFIIKRYVLEPLCFIGTNKCMKIEYQQYENSVLVHMIPSGYWVWFDGKDILVYGEPTGKVCKDEGYESTYVYDVSARKVIGYMCAKDLTQVKAFYERQKASKQYIFKKNVSVDFNVYDLINLLANEKIINIG